MDLVDFNERTTKNNSNYRNSKHRLPENKKVLHSFVNFLL